MRRFLVATAVIGASLISAAPDALAQCRGGWCAAGCGRSGCRYVKLLSRNYPFVSYQVVSPNGTFNVEADCQQYKSRYLNSDGTKDPWKDAMPGSVGRKVIETACNM